MNRDFTDYILYALAAVLVCFMLVTGSTALAGMIDTERAVAAEQAGQERERVKVLLDRHDVAKQMQALGVSPDDVRGRIDAMTDQEVHALAGRLSSLPAAGFAPTEKELIIIVLLVVLLALAL